ncbi:hypothetical protein BC829DRAFT_448172 [Chytridium lagenaria]|nr:hypothetical protein BC829DRAFT_448172 [Chytridium lagenaria]
MSISLSSLDACAVKARHVESSIKDLLSTLSKPAPHFSFTAQQEFLEAQTVQCMKMAEDVEAMERLLMDAPLESVLQTIRRRAADVAESTRRMQKYLEQYGYTPDFAEPEAEVEYQLAPTTPSSKSLLSELPPMSFDSPDANASFSMKTPAGKDNMFGFEEEDEPPSPTLESLGISEFGLGLIKGLDFVFSLFSVVGPLCGSDEWFRCEYTSDTHSNTPSSTRLSAWSTSNRALSDMSSPAHHLQPSWIDGGIRSWLLELLGEVSEEEFGMLPNYLAAQLSIEFLNDTISEINEYFTDKRFSGMDVSDDNDLVTIEELQQVETIEASKIKGVMVALLHLNRMDSEDDGRGGKRYRIKT